MHIFVELVEIAALLGGIIQVAENSQQKFADQVSTQESREVFSQLTVYFSKLRTRFGVH